MKTGSKVSMPECPLCSNWNNILIRSVHTDLLQEKWLTQYGLDVSEEFGNLKTISLVHCPVCQIQFFSPLLAGSERLYVQLQQFDWYYLKQKWEYDVALQDIKDCRRVLEVGCGTGHFVTRVLSETKANIQGIDLNKDAIRQAQEVGLPACSFDLRELVEKRAEVYDAICSFQVLEHIANPREFISSCIDLLARSGKLIVSVPNSDGYLRFTDGVLNQPPHHVLRWSQASLEYLTKIFPLRLTRVEFEPVADYHIGGYCRANANRLLSANSPGLRRLVGGAAARLVGPILKLLKINRYLRGHTIYVCFQRL